MPKLIAAIATAWLALSAPMSALAEPATAEPGPQPSCVPQRFKIAVDVGHTVEAPGATSARGVKEYVFNLRLATEIETALKDAGFQTHLIVISGDKRSQLFPRPVRANALGVDLFISIHHNDVQERYHDKWEYEGVSRPYSDTFSGYSLFVSGLNRHYRESLAFGRLLGHELRARGLHYSPHQAEDIPGERRPLLDAQGGVFRYDHLFVLKETHAPALLVEAGIIVNRNDELVLQSPEHRALITAATLSAVQQFCAVQQAKPKARPMAKKR